MPFLNFREKWRVAPERSATSADKATFPLSLVLKSQKAGHSTAEQTTDGKYQREHIPLWYKGNILRCWSETSAWAVVKQRG